jgi:hypothetical protein
MSNLLNSKGYNPKMEENWVPIFNYEENYLVSDKGDVKNKKTSRILKGKLKHKTGKYLEVTLCVNGNKKSHYVHQLVANTFVENNNAEKNKTIHHMNGNKQDNSASNLEWVEHVVDTPKLETIVNKNKENNSHVRTGRKVEQYSMDTKELIATYDSIQQAANSTDSNAKKISAVCGKCPFKYSHNKFYWKHFEENINERDFKEIDNYPEYLVSPKGFVYSKKTKKELKNDTSCGRQPCVIISNENGKKTFFIHRLVAEYFIENPENNKYVHHKDSDINNNNVENLYWSNSQKNDSDRVVFNKSIQCLKDDELIAEYKSVKEANEATNIDNSSIVRVCQGKQKTAGGFKWNYA